MVDNFVILDCDIGTDDAWALLMLIKAEKLRNYKILGVTCVNGNTTVDNASLNTLRILSTVERTDIPVFKGAYGPIFCDRRVSYFHGKDGLGNCAYKEAADPAMLQKKHAVNAMYDFVCEYPQKITLILVGPLTNVALCLNMYPDFAEKVKEVYIMGGNTKGMGNATRSAEFNFYVDPEAAYIVLNKITCPITIVPLETCLYDNLDLSLDWRLNVLGSTKNRITNLLNPAEKDVYERSRRSWIPCDAILTAVFLFPANLIKKEAFWHATVEIHGKYTRGQMVLDHLKDQNNKENVRVIEKIDCDEFKEIALWTVKQPSDN